MVERGLVDVVVEQREPERGRRDQRRSITMTRSTASVVVVVNVVLQSFMDVLDCVTSCNACDFDVTISAGYCAFAVTSSRR